MATDGSIPIGTSEATVSTKGIFIPANKPLSHLSTQMIEKINNTLQAQGLLVTAQGGVPAKCKAIQDFPIDKLPKISQSSHNFTREFSSRLEHERRNRENEMKRRNLVLEERTKVYCFVVSICENALELKRDIISNCGDYEGYADHQDGPRAYRMVLDHLGVGGDGTARTKPDKEFYNRALVMQQQGQLPDGCTGEAFSAQVHAFIVHINPNLATSFNDPFDAVQHILDMLPLELRTDGRDLKRELKQTMQWKTPRPEDGLTFVMQRCKVMVEEVQRADAPKPTFVATPDHRNLDLGELARVTGMCVTGIPATTRELNAGGFLADDKKTN